MQKATKSTLYGTKSNHESLTDSAMGIAIGGEERTGHRSVRNIRINWAEIPPLLAGFGHIRGERLLRHHHLPPDLD